MLVKIVTAMTCTILIITAHASMEVPTIMTEQWPPYNYTENGMAKGFSVEIVRAMMSELKIKSEFIFLPGARGEKYLQQKKNHMLFTLFRTKKRDGIYKWIGPIANDSIYIYKKVGSKISIKTFDDAKKVKRFAVRREGMVLSFLQNLKFDNLVKVTDSKSIINKVVTGVADLLASDSSFGISYHLKQMNLPANSLERTSVKLFTLPLYIGCSKDIPDNVIQKWQGALEKIKKSGKYQQIYNRYLNYK